MNEHKPHETEPTSVPAAAPVEPKPLQYINPKDDFLRQRREKRRTFAGAWLATPTVLGLVFYWIVNNLRLHSSAPRLSNFGPLMISGIALLLLGGITLALWSRAGSIAFGKGILIGTGIALLIAGLCFAAAIIK